MTDGELDSFFDRLLHRLPRPEERELLLRTQKELDIKDDEGIWLLLVVLGHYQQLYGEIPDKILSAGSFAIEQAKRRLELETEAERKRLQGALTDAVLETIKVTTVDRVKAERRSATAAAAGVCLIVAALVSFVSYRWGSIRGHAVATEEQLWAASEQGQYARKLENGGLLPPLKECLSRAGEIRIDVNGWIFCPTGNRDAWPTGRISRKDLKPH
jgi:hypothetical protein